MIKKWRYGWLFPLVLAICLGGLSAWLERITEVKVEEASFNPNEPQYTMYTINGSRFDETGHVKENLQAQRAWQMPKSDDVYFSSPQLTLYDNGALIYKVNSDKARYHTVNHQILFEENVVLTKSAEATKPYGILRTSSLSVNADNKVAHTDAEVTYQYGQSFGSAHGLTYDYQSGFLNLPLRVRTVIYDPKNS